MGTADHHEVLNPLFRTGHRLKIGIFCTNTYPALTNVPEITIPSWGNCLKVARLADGMGLDAIVPIARWKGYVDDCFDNKMNEVFDTFTYAAAIAQATQHCAIFATTHAPTVHPVAVAKQTATIDAISGGRFTLNVVGGWNRREFDMFGIDLLDHAQRYQYLAEWLALLKRLWSAQDEFDYESASFRLRRALSRPQPVQRPHIPIMNAGLSTAGMRFAAVHSDIALITLFGPDPMAWERQVADYKKLARNEFGRELQVWTNIMVTLGETKQDAEAYLVRYSDEYVDHDSVESFLATLSQENGIVPGSERHSFMRRNISMGLGLPIVGSADDVASQLKIFSDIGLDGVIMTYVDFIDGLQRFERDVLPLLETAQIRRPHRLVQ